MFLKVFLCKIFALRVSKMPNLFLLKNSFRSIFTSKSLVRPYPRKWGSHFQFLLKFTQRVLWLLRDSFTRSSFLRNLFCASVNISRITSRKAYPQNDQIFNFKSQTVTVFQTLYFAPSVPLLTQNTISLKISSKSQDSSKACFNIFSLLIP